MVRRTTPFLVSTLVALVASGGGCSGKSSNTSPDGEASLTPDSGPAPISGLEGGTEGGTGTLTGTIKDSTGVPVLGAKVEAGGASVFSDAQGRFTLANLPAGPVTVNITQSWFQPAQQAATIAAGTSVTLDTVLPEMAMKIEPADRALAMAYQQTFDWTRQTLSMAIVEEATRRAFDNAVYFHNPALYRDTSAQPPVTPAPQPAIVGGIASGFAFPVSSGANAGQEALDPTTIVDAIKDTPLGPTEPADFMMWTPMMNWLAEWDSAKSATLKVAGQAVRQQGWGGNTIRPQDIEKVYLDPTTQKLWVKVGFESYVQLGAGIADDDGDGRKEIYAAVNSVHYGPEIIDALSKTYTKVTFTTYGMSKEVSKSLNEIYSTTGAQVERYIGQPYDVPGVGTITYPFVVLKHAGGQKNAILLQGTP